MPLLADPLTSRNARRWAGGFTLWNRKLHYYLGLYFLFFVWLFALTGLLLNHSSWAFAQFFPNRRVTRFERAIQSPAPGGDLDQARDVMHQLGIEGEIAWSAARSDPDRLEFTASRPGHIYQIQADLKQAHVKAMLTEFNGWGIARTLHAFVGVSPEDNRNQRDWTLTTVWALSMDAVAAGVILMVLTGIYLWWGSPEKRRAGLVALGSGAAVCGLFVVGLRWIYG
ncbi:MAG TPA: PepSY-associated TM helix domain-containing protein [Bryobacteraceae bacterium]